MSANGSRARQRFFQALNSKFARDAKLFAGVALAMGATLAFARGPLYERYAAQRWEKQKEEMATMQRGAQCHVTSISQSPSQSELQSQIKQQ